MIKMMVFHAESDRQFETVDVIDAIHSYMD